MNVCIILSTPLPPREGIGDYFTQPVSGFDIAVTLAGARPLIICDSLLTHA